MWPDVHHGLIEVIRDFLVPRLRPKYRVAIEKRTYLEEPEGLMLVGRPDVALLQDPLVPAERKAAGDGSKSSAVKGLTVSLPMPDVIEEAYLLIRDLASGEVVTVMEVLSPANKRPGEGRRIYEIKRQKVLGSSTHLVEIDLLRGGAAMAVFAPENKGAPYGILVSRSPHRPKAELFRFGVRDAIPSFPIPLGSGDAEPQLELQRLLAELYDRAGYDLAVDYSRNPALPLGAEDEGWAIALLSTKGLR